MSAVNKVFLIGRAGKKEEFEIAEPEPGVLDF